MNIKTNEHINYCVVATLIKYRASIARHDSSYFFYTLKDIATLLNNNLIG